MNHYVYEIENKINHKKYIGKHSCECEFLDSDYYGSGTLIKRAIKKYGKNNFTRKVIGKYNTEQEAYDAEQDYIQKCAADKKDNYYNLCKGGHVVNCGEKATPINRIVPYGNSQFIILEQYLYADSSITKIIECEDWQPSFDVLYYIGYLIKMGYVKDKIKEVIYKKYYYYDDLFLNKCISKMYLLNENELSFLYSSHPFSICNSEIDKINQIKSRQQKIYAMVSLLLYKAYANSNDEYVYFNRTHINHYCGSGILKDRIDIIFDYLINNKFIELNKTCDRYRVPFATFDNDDVFVNVEKITSTTKYILDLYNGENIIRCEKCGDFVKGNKNGTKKYCKPCSSYVLKRGKIKKCVDCGKYFSTNSMNRSVRCKDCYEIERKRICRERQRERRSRQKSINPKSA